jgi:hypothetical protein
VSINAKGDIVAIGAQMMTTMVVIQDQPKCINTSMVHGINWVKPSMVIQLVTESGYSVSINAKGDIVAIGAILDDNSGK